MTTATTSPTRAGASAAMLPTAVSILVVTARPGQESADLGGLLYAFRHEGAHLSLLCLTRGEAAGQNATCALLEAVRPWELQLAAAVLGISEVTVADYPDGKLHQYPVAELTDRIRRAIRQHTPGLLLIIDPQDSDRDDTAVARAARAAATQAGVPMVARTRPAAPGAWMIDLGAGFPAARAIQKCAAAAHASQSAALPTLIRRLHSLGGWEALRWLLFPGPVPPQRDPGNRESTQPS